MTTIGSLFSGIGGLDLGVERSVPGARIVWQAESDPAARRVLERWWRNVRRYNDVRDIDGRAERPDIICGGFPCQDISDAGKRAGIDGERSGLWSEYARIVGLLRPRIVFVENVAALIGRGLDRVLGDLSALGLDAEWETFRAADVGAPHLRDRVFVLAYANGSGGDGWQREPGRRSPGGITAVWHGARGHGTGLADAASARRHDAEDAQTDRGDESAGAEADGRRAAGNSEPERDGDMADPVRGRQRARERDVCAGESDADRCGEINLADTVGSGREGDLARDASRSRRPNAAESGQIALAHADSDGCQGIGRGGVFDRERTPRGNDADRRDRPSIGAHRFPPGPDRIAGWDGPQPAIRRGDDGAPGRTHRLRLLGNAVVPQQAALAFQTLIARATARTRERAA